MIKMKDKGPEKFYSKFDATYYDVFMLKFKTIVDFVKPFQKKIGVEEANKIVEKIGDEDGVKLVNQLLTQMPVNNFEDFKKLFMSLLNSKNFQVALNYEIIENSEKKFELKVTDCLYAKAFRDLNEPEIGYCSVCNGDFAMAKAFHSKIKLTRTKTLMQGNDYCDHCYTWEE